MLARLGSSIGLILRTLIVFAFLGAQFPPAAARANTQGQSEAGTRRLALVVGNSDYVSVPGLKNPVPDAALIADTLRDLDFEVIEETNLSRRDFDRVITRVASLAEDYEAVLFYYAGHGFQLEGRNFLVPVDAKLTDRKRMTEETVSLDEVISRLQSRNRQTLIFLDACRNNPIPASVKDKDYREGLAQMEAGSGTFVAFATEPGDVTNDGAGENSPFSAALAQHMVSEGISISDMMIRVRNTVEETTLQRQTPWDQSSLRSQFYFNPATEDTDSLTEEDLALLQHLDPALLAKFKKRFGLNLSDEVLASIDSGEAEQPEVIATIVPALRIEAADPEEEVAEDPLAAEDPVLDDTSTETDVASGDDAAPAEEVATVKPGLMILDADEAEEVAETETPAAREPQTEVAEAPAVETTMPAAPAPEETAVAPSSAEPAPPAFEAPVEVALATPGEIERTAPAARTVPEAPVLAEEPAIPAPQIEETEIAPAPTQESPAEMAAPASAPVEETKPALVIEIPPSPFGDKPMEMAAVSPDFAVAPPVAAPLPADDVSELTSDDLAPAEDVIVPPADNAAAPVEQEPAPPATPEPAVAAPTVPVEDLMPAFTSPTELASAPPVPAPEAAPTPAPVVTEGALKGSETAVADARPAPEKPAPGAGGAAVLVPAPKLAPPPVKPAQATPEPAEVEVASVDLSAVTPEAVAPGPGSVLTEPAPPVDFSALSEEEKRELATRAQRELQRLGCYRSDIDGDWGPKSARAILRFYAEQKQAPDEIEPTEALIAMLSAIDTVVCKTTIIEKPETKPATKPSSSKRATPAPAPKKPAVTRQETPRQKPASKPAVASNNSSGGNAKKLTKSNLIGAFR